MRDPSQLLADPFQLLDGQAGGEASGEAAPTEADGGGSWRVAPWGRAAADGSGNDDDARTGAPELAPKRESMVSEGSGGPVSP